MTQGEIDISGILIRKRSGSQQVCLVFFCLSHRISEIRIAFLRVCTGSQAACVMRCIGKEADFVICIRRPVFYGGIAPCGSIAGYQLIVHKVGSGSRRVETSAFGEIGENTHGGG